MSNRSKNISKNLILTLVARISYLLIGFLTRKLIIQLIDVQYLGLSSLYSNLLDFLNLAELGIGVAIQVRVYAPLVKGENDKIYNIIKIAQKIYAVIGAVVMAVGFGSSFLLPFLIKQNPFPNWYVQTAYLISVLGIALSYFCASKRLYFEANEKYYVVTLSDLIVKLLFTAAGLLALYLTREYLYYAAFIAVQGVLSNFTLSLHFRRVCPHLRGLGENKDFQKSERKVILKSLKDVVPMKLGVYIFSSTDGLVITSFIGLTASAIYSNYNLISLSLLSISSMISNALVSTFGKIEKESDDRAVMLKQYKIYENVQYVFSVLTAVCMLFLYDRFMTAWVGKDYLIGKVCVLLLSLDYLVHSSFQPLSTLYTSTCKFKEDKICALLAAGINIGLSVVLVIFMGLPGVIIGTLTANIFTFIVRTYIINKKYFNRSFAAIVLKPLLFLALFCVESVLCYFAVHYVHLDNKWLDFIVPAIICLAVTGVISLVLLKKLGCLKIITDKINLRNSKLFKLIKRVLRPLYNKIKDGRANRLIKKNFPARRGETVKVVFICQAQHIWNKVLPFVDYLRKDNFYRVILFVVKDENEDNSAGNVFVEYAEQNGVEYRLYEKGLLEKLHADYIIYPRPYDYYLPKDVRSSNAVRFSRLCYIPYGYSTMELGAVNLNCAFTRNIAVFFADMDYSFEYFNNQRKKNVVKGVQKSFNIGYPYLEYLSAQGESEFNNSAFNGVKNSGLKIIWTPRWTADDKLGGSNFLRYIDGIFADFVGNEEYSFVFRPHPYALDNYIKKGLITAEQKEKYLNALSESGNSAYDNADNYWDTLCDADVAIMDVSSIVPERFLTGKPIIFCHNEGEEVLNDTFKEMLKYTYNAYGYEDIRKIVAEIKSGNDYMKAERLKYCEQFKESLEGACKRYKEVIESDYESRCALKKRR